MITAPPKAHYLRTPRSLVILEKQHALFKMNAATSPYAGCQEGCVFCPHSSAERVGVKTNFLHDLDRELKKQGQALHLGLGESCEPYNALEREFNLTRNAIELAIRYKTPIHIFTKSELVLRDIDLLSAHSLEGLLAVSVSASSLDSDVLDIFEPGLSSFSDRLKILKELKQNGIFAGLVLSPIIPFISDAPEQIEEAFSRAKEAGVDYIIPMVLRLCTSAVRERFMKLILLKFPKIHHRLESLYHLEDLPPATYTDRIKDLITKLSLEYDLPTLVPLESDVPCEFSFREDFLE